MIWGLYAALASSIRLAAAGGNDAWVPTQRALAAPRWLRQRVRWTRGPVPTRTRASDSPARSAIGTELWLECAAGGSHGRRCTPARDTSPCSRASCRNGDQRLGPRVHLRDLAGGARASAPCPAYQYTGSNRDYGCGVARSAGAIPSAPVRSAQAAAPPGRGRGRAGRNRARRRECRTQYYGLRNQQWPKCALVTSRSAAH